jgi:hypothetical protein
MKNVLLLCCVILFSLVQHASACSRLRQPAEEEFRNALAVFRGTGTSAELIKPKFLSTEQAKDDFYLYTKVRWKVDEVFKGEHLEGKAAIELFFCGSGPIVVGAPYVFVIDKPSEDLEVGGDVIGLFSAVGPFSFQEDMGAFDKLVREVRKLSKRK